MAFHGQQILHAVRDALKRTVALALDLGVGVLGFSNRGVAQRQRQGVIAGTDSLQTVAKSPRQLPTAENSLARRFAVISLMLAKKTSPEGFAILRP